MYAHNGVTRAEEWRGSVSYGGIAGLKSVREPKTPISIIKQTPENDIKEIERYRHFRQIKVKENESTPT